MSRRCQKFEELIDKRAAGLSEGERLTLEEHLSACPSCVQTLRAMEQVTQLLRSAQPSLSDNARERALSRALGNAHEPRKLHTARLPGAWLQPVAIAAAALLVVVSGVYLSRDTAQPVASTLVKPTVQQPQPAQTVSKPAAEDAWVVAQNTEQRTFGHARVQLSAGTRLRFDAASSTLALADGKVDVDVDASVGKRFIVQTELFRVEVLGTQFSVTRDQVQVQHGKVRVVDLTGQLLAPALTAGEQYRYGQPQAKAERPTVSAQALLSRARAALGQAELSNARALLREAKPLLRGKREQAEALTLEAECALLDRDKQTARKRYEQVAKRFAELPAGENAAFAAAQLAKSANDLAGARKLFTAYVARYPKGRFAREAEAHLSALKK